MKGYYVLLLSGSLFLMSHITEAQKRGYLDFDLGWGIIDKPAPNNPYGWNLGLNWNILKSPVLAGFSIGSHFLSSNADGIVYTDTLWSNLYKIDARLKQNVVPVHGKISFDFSEVVDFPLVPIVNALVGLRVWNGKIKATYRNIDDDFGSTKHIINESTTGSLGLEAGGKYEFVGGHGALSFKWTSLWGNKAKFIDDNEISLSGINSGSSFLTTKSNTYLNYFSVGLIFYILE
ncbi:MAG: hypothetical protein MRY83_11970 [Flavobacteriales bacterium]|nr:hypothetical protein [Flavobacteriales bacterium]